MKEAERFPIPEQLLGRKKYDKFTLYIDSLISAAYNEKSIQENAYYIQEVDAPFNSMESADDFSLGPDTDSDEAEKFPKTAQKAKNDPEIEKKRFDMSLLETWPFKIETVRSFPYRTREGDIPTKLLKYPRLNWIQEA